jgi:preprotein translocase subunit YajC
VRTCSGGANRKVITVPIAAASSGGGNILVTLLPLILLFGVMYFLMIRPQQRRRREAQQLQSTLGPGDEVVTIGGLYGTIVEADDEAVTLEIAPGVHARYARPAIARTISSAQVDDEEEEEFVDDEDEHHAEGSADLAESSVIERRDKD